MMTERASIGSACGLEARTGDRWRTGARTFDFLMEQLLLMDQGNEEPTPMDPSIDIEGLTGKLVVRLCMAGVDHPLQRLQPPPSWGG
jgi:hypothetical protein